MEHDDGIYQIELIATLNVTAEDAWAVFTDFENLKRINPAIQKTEVLSPDSAQDQSLATAVRVCVWFYCRLINQVQAVSMQPGNESTEYRMAATIQPEVSDFKSGNADWSFKNCSGKTCLQFAATLQPKFWVPPVIGPWLIGRKLEAEALETSLGIEREAIRRRSIASAEKGGKEQ